MLLISFLFPSCQLRLLSPSPSPNISVCGFVQKVFFYWVHILRCLGPAQAQPVYKSSRWSHDVVWIGSVWSALLPAREGTGSVFPHYWHRAGWIWNRLAVKVEVLRALVHNRSLRNLQRDLSVLGAGCPERTSSLRLRKQGIISLYEQLCWRGSWASSRTDNPALVLELVHVSYSGNWTLLVITSAYFPSLPRTGILF